MATTYHILANVLNDISQRVMKVFRQMNHAYMLYSMGYPMVAQPWPSKV